MTVKKGDIHFRIPEPEKEVIARAAEMAGKGLSEYARDILLAASDYCIADIRFYVYQIMYKA